MKILFVIPSITNYFTFLEELISDLISHGHELHLAASQKAITSNDPYTHSPVCEFYPIDFPRALTLHKHLKAAKKLRRLVHRIRPDFISVHFSAAIFTTMLARKQNWPVTIGTVHGLGSPLISGWRRKVIAMAENWAFQRIDELYVLTADDQLYLQKKPIHINVKLLGSRGLGCNLEKFNPARFDSGRKEQLRRELGISPTDFVYIFIGRQTKFKGFDAVLEAFFLTRKTHPRSRLLLVGARDNIHPVSTRFPGRPGEEEHVINIGWQEKVADFLAVSHLNVFPSEREGMPVNLMESLSMGVPVITVNSRGCKEVVEDGVTGVVLKNRSVEDIAEAMVRLQENTEELSRLSANALAQRQKFDRREFITENHRILYKLSGVKSPGLPGLTRI